MKGLSARAVIVASLVSIVGAVGLCPIQGLSALTLAAAIVIFASVFFRRRIGGVTGDCFGATFQLVEIATYAAFLA